MVLFLSLSLHEAMHCLDELNRNLPHISSHILKTELAILFLQIIIDFLGSEQVVLLVLGVQLALPLQLRIGKVSAGVIASCCELQTGCFDD